MKKKEIRNGRKHAYAHGLHCVDLHDAAYDEENFEEVDDLDDDDIAEFPPCFFKDWDNDCTDCPHDDEEHCHLRPVKISDEIFELIDAIIDKRERILAEAEDEEEDEYTPLHLFLDQGPEFISRVAGLVMLGEAAFECGAPVYLPDVENGRIGFLGLTEEGEITRERINSIAYVTTNENGERDYVMMDGDKVGSTFTDMNETMKHLSEMFKQFDAFEETTFAMIRKWLAD